MNFIIYYVRIFQKPSIQKTNHCETNNFILHRILYDTTTKSISIFKTAKQRKVLFKTQQNIWNLINDFIKLINDSVRKFHTAVCVVIWIFFNFFFFTVLLDLENISWHNVKNWFENLNIIFNGESVYGFILPNTRKYSRKLIRWWKKTAIRHTAFFSNAIPLLLFGQ